jgi:DNA (cytosine-5)-methyltransferase 1
MLHEEFKFKHKPIKLFEAFSGYGSQFMALKRLNIDVEVIGYSEIDKYAIKVYEALHGKHKNYGGIGSFNRFPKSIDICTWSFPCQDISLAGKQRGMTDGSRSNYGYVFLDTIANTPYDERPKVLLMENVKALFSQTFAEDWREIQLRLERLGYTSYSEVLNAKDYGVAQNRERVFIVSILGEYYYEFPKSVKLEKRLKDYLEDEVDDKYYLSDKMFKYIKSRMPCGKNKITTGINISNKNEDFIAGTICTSGGNQPSDNFIIENENIIYDKKIGDIKIKTWNDETKAYKTRDDDMPRHRIYETDSIGFTITTNESQQPCILIPEATQKGYTEASDGDGVYINRPHQKRGVVQKGMIQTIKTSCDDVGVVDNLRIRKLTPREALRLMAVSERDIDIILSEVSDTQAYKLAGNSIVVNVLVEIFRKLF